MEYSGIKHSLHTHHHHQPNQPIWLLFLFLFAFPLQPSSVQIPYFSLDSIYFPSDSFFSNFLNFSLSILAIVLHPSFIAAYQLAPRTHTHTLSHTHHIACLACPAFFNTCRNDLTHSIPSYYTDVPTLSLYLSQTCTPPRESPLETHTHTHTHTHGVAHVPLQEPK